MEPNCVLNERSVNKKLINLPSVIHRALRGERSRYVPLLPARDVAVLPMRSLPEKPGLSKPEGKGRLLHDLASIELQAMELGLRTLLEFPDAAPDFREQLAEITLAEGRHLQLCLEGIERTGFSWGHWPVHIALWSATAREDSLLDRLLIVHRYLEGGGLDASVSIQRRLNGVADLGLSKIVNTILSEEVGHVAFGSRWYKELAKSEGLDPDEDFAKRLPALFPRLPRRMEKIDRDLRARAGFTDRELICLEHLQTAQKIDVKTSSPVTAVT